MRILFVLASLAVGLPASAEVAVFKEADSYRYGAAYRYLTTQTAEACAAVCADDAQCLAWNFNPTSHGGRETCELKASPGHRADLVGRVSGLSPAHEQAMAEIEPSGDPFAPRSGRQGRSAANAAFGPAERSTAGAELAGGTGGASGSRSDRVHEASPRGSSGAIPAAQGRIVGSSAPSRAARETERSGRETGSRDYYPDRDRFEAPETRKRPSRMED